MTTPLTFPDAPFNRRKLIKGAAALAATAVTAGAASAETVAPLGQTGAPTRSTDKLPLGPLPGSRYPDSHLESAKKGGQADVRPGRLPGLCRHHGGRARRNRHALGRRAGLLPGRALRAVLRHPQQPHHALLGG